MSAANQVTEQQRQRLLTGHYALSHREMVRYWLLSEEDIKRINGRRREHNRLGYAVQLCLLRYPGWPLKTDEPPPPNLLKYVGQQFGADTVEFADYAKRDNTRQEHQLLIIKEYRFRQYGLAGTKRGILYANVCFQPFGDMSDSPTQRRRAFLIVLPRIVFQQHRVALAP